MIMLQFFALLNSIVVSKMNFDQCVKKNGQLLHYNICLLNAGQKITSPEILVKPIVCLSNLIEFNKKTASISAIFDIYLSWKDPNLVTNISSLNTVFFLKIW